MKKKVLIFSDCYFFAGCENVLVNLLKDRKMNEEFSLYYSYRYSKEYQEGVNRNFNQSVKKIPLSLLSFEGFWFKPFFSNLNRLTKFILNLIIQVINGSKIYTLYNLIKLYGIFKKVKPDLLHINNGGYPGALTCQVAVFSAKLARIPRIIYNVNNLAYRRNMVFEKFIDDYIKNNVDFFVTASKQAKFSLRTNRQFDNGRIIQIFNVMIQPNVVKKRKELLESLKIQSHKFIIVEVALLTARKGQIYLLKALNVIKEKHPEIYKNILVILVGEGEERPALEKFVVDCNLKETVRFVGYRNDYYDFINCADLFILPSISQEDMPLVILSAMNLRKPIISTALAGISEEIQDNVEGILLNPNELFKLPDVIVKLYSDENLRLKFGENAYKKHTENFSYYKIISIYIDLYRKLTRGTSD